ncbi:NYN domain-containing protein [Nocardioides albertanoniae]|uniref:NYN domain-containing protein n=1 Tax=Nocardioides albertanoniae TaxID=1175486 RepID=UPI00114E00D2|nr:NYN domain-containing protein [Nocardioides albertanoniae]
MTEPFRIALLIDADNAPAAKIDAILNDLAEYGEVTIRRAYGNWTKPELKGWIGELHDAAIRPMQQFDLTAHKNASDMALAIDAVELLHAATPDAFALVSSDSDFTPLVHYLREKGQAVYGYGREKTPAPFKSACTRFTVVEKLGGDADEETEAANGEGRTRKRSSATTGQALKGNARLIQLLRNSIDAAADDDGWALVGTVVSRIRNQSSEDPRNYGYSTWTKLIKAIDLFELKDEGTSAIAVGDRRNVRK